MLTRRKLLIIRLALSALVGLVVFGISVLVVWRNSPKTLMTNTTLHAWTRYSLRKGEDFIQERLRETGRPPESLQEFAPELAEETFSNSRVPIIKKGMIVDGWGRPLQYTVQETSYTLQSLGRDGKPGGTGFDRDRSYFTTIDLDSDGPIWSNPPMPTFRQFLFELPTAGMIRGCALSGIIAFLAAMFIIRPTKLSAKHSLGIGLQIVFTALAAVVFAWFIMQLHTPTGH